MFEEDVSEFEDVDLEEVQLTFDSPSEELLSHRSFQMTTPEDWADCCADGGEQEEEDFETEQVWETANTRWFFEMTAQSEGKTWHQYLLEEQGISADSYQLGHRLAMWDGREDFVSLNRVVHVRDQFPYLSYAYDPATDSAEPLQKELPADLDPEAMLHDIQALSTALQLQAAYPIKWFGSARGSDLLPCMFQLPPGTKLAPRAVWALLGIDPQLAAQFPEPVAFSTGDSFSNYMSKQINEWREGWEEFVQERVSDDEVDEDMVEYLEQGPQFQELAEKAEAFAQYVDPPILQVMAGSKNLGMDPVPFFWLGKSPGDPERVLGMMGAVWYEDVNLGGLEDLEGLLES